MRRKRWGEKNFHLKLQVLSFFPLVSCHYFLFWLRTLFERELLLLFHLSLLYLLVPKQTPQANIRYVYSTDSFQLKVMRGEKDIILDSRKKVGGGSEVISLVTRISLLEHLDGMRDYPSSSLLVSYKTWERKVEEGTSKTLICTSVRLDYDQYSGSGSSLRWWMRTVILLIMPPNLAASPWHPLSLPTSLFHVYLLHTPLLLCPSSSFILRRMFTTDKVSSDDWNNSPRCECFFLRRKVSSFLSKVHSL